MTSDRSTATETTDATNEYDYIETIAESKTFYESSPSRLSMSLSFRFFQSNGTGLMHQQQQQQQHHQQQQQQQQQQLRWCLKRVQFI